MVRPGIDRAAVHFVAVGASAGGLEALELFPRFRYASQHAGPTEPKEPGRP